MPRAAGGNSRNKRGEDFSAAAGARRHTLAPAEPGRTDRRTSRLGEISLPTADHTPLCAATIDSSTPPGRPDAVTRRDATRRDTRKTDAKQERRAHTVTVVEIVNCIVNIHVTQYSEYNTAVTRLGWQ